MVALNATHVLMTGGFDGTRLLNQVFMFSSLTGEWTELPPMTEKRGGHSCGVVSGGTELVVAGGYISKSNSEILDLSTLIWRSGPALPSIRESSASVPYENSFLMVGGFMSGGILFEDILQYDADAESWITRPEKLDFGRDRAVAMMVPDEMVECKHKTIKDYIA